MKWITLHARRLLGIDDSSPFEESRNTSPRRIRIRATVGAAAICGLAIVVLSIVMSKIGSAHPTQIPSDLRLTQTPESSDNIQFSSTVMVHVVGEVNLPGMYELKTDSRVIDAVMAAGGLTVSASECGVNLARVINDGEQLSIPSITQGCTSSQSNSLPGASISLNTAQSEQFDSLPGIGPTLAQRIVQYRDVHGGFTSLEQLNEVPGIGDKLFAGLKDLVTL